MSGVALFLVALFAALPPAPTKWVEDHAAFLTPGTREAVDARLAGYQRSTGHQVIVWIDKTLDGAALDDWAVRTFEAWKIGRKGIDDGIAIFIFADDRAIDIEVGYGLEGRVPDAIASRIIREVMTPRLQSGDRDGAVIAGVDAVLSAIEGRQWTGAPATATAEDQTGVTWVLYIVMGIIALLVFIKYPRAGAWLFWAIIAGGRGGGSHGGFRGGGGRSGGGGARGHWNLRR